MAMTSVQKLRWTLTLHFAVIAWLTAMLVSTGSGSIFLPLFIFLVSCAALIFVDGLQWFEIGRIGSYIGMTVATIISISSYFYSAFSVPSESGQLMAIAGLLVYPEAVLFLQRKNLRIFEQLAVFLLLEMIVAALVNDNILFGILLAPIMLLWVSALFLFSRYATLVQIDPTLETPLPTLREILFRKFVKTVLGEAPKVQVVSPQLQLPEVHSSRTLRRTLQSIPIGLGAILFSGFFFYLLPRTATTSLDPSIGYETNVGLPKSLTIGTVGRLLLDRTPVMRVSLTHSLTGQAYPLQQPPYLRARVMDSYGSSNRGRLATQREWVFGGIQDYQTLKGIDNRDRLSAPNRDAVRVEFEIKRQFAGAMFTIPPVFSNNKQQAVPLNYDNFNMLLEELDPTRMPRGKAIVYELESMAFAEGNQLRVMPALGGRNAFSQNRNLYVLHRDFRHFASINDFRMQALQQSETEANNAFAVASFYERLLLSPPFSYSLDLLPPSDPNMDPIEDFVLHQRRGHCQYFASALLIMMRQSGIPSRIVVGYRPTEFNKLGSYFPVKQSDAHAWVEGLFERENLVGTPLERWLPDSPAVWVRFDPTPASDGAGYEIVEQPGQAMDYADKLWKDYVVSGQKLNNDSSLYAPVSETGKNAYQKIVERFQELRQELENGQLFRSSGGIGFAWQVAILITAVGFMAILVWRALLILPRIAPQLARKLGMLRDERVIRQAFFARCIALLERQGFKRNAAETPQEFTDRAAAQWSAADAAPPANFAAALAQLTSLYYRLRFGAAQGMTAAEEAATETALQQVEAAVRDTPR